MTVEIRVQLSDSEAGAVLRSEGFSNGWGVHKSIALRKAQDKIIGAISKASASKLGKGDPE